MSANQRRHRHFIVFILFFFICCFSQAQTADFTVNKTGGCSPLDVRFTNTSSGLSAGASYKWDFGNTNTSTLKDPGTTYKDEQVYTVTLTVTDKGNIYTKTLDITVYKKPVVDFSADIAKGCLPLPVTLTSNSTPGDGTITSYFWDYGDGTAKPGEQTTEHTYKAAQPVTAGLTVTNSFGCYATVNKNIVEVLSAVEPSFDAVPATVCNINDPVSFQNNSQGPGTLTYAWNFGDGKSASGATASHVYGVKGSYNVTLTVTSSEGCVAELTKDSLVNVANFNTAFDMPPVVCENSEAVFTDISVPAADAQTWKINSVVQGGAQQILTHTFSPAKNYRVTLINSYGNCKDTAVKTVRVKPSPQTKDFLLAMQGNCGAPVEVKFQDTTTTPVSWEWDFNYSDTGFNVMAAGQTAAYTYTADGTYRPALRLTNDAGCSTTITKQVVVSKPNVTIQSSNGPEGCLSLNTTFYVHSDAEIAEYRWSFGDGGNGSGLPQPKRSFTTPGVYTVTLNYTTKAGCKGAAAYSVTIFEKPKLDFVADLTTVCGDNPVTFTVLGADGGQGAYAYYWLFGDNNSGTSTSTGISHRYYRDETFTVTLIVSNGTCADTIVKENYITVLPPFPRITAANNTCEGDRGMVSFEELSRKAEKWAWNFGDGSAEVSYSNYKPEITHHFTKTGTYQVVLTATNGGCSVQDTIITSVLLKQDPLLSAEKTEVCSDGSLQLYISRMETNPVESFYQYDIIKQVYADGSAFNGTLQTGQQWLSPHPFTLQNWDNGKNGLQVITRSYNFGCDDTTNLIPLAIKGPVADFEMTVNNVCFKTPVGFKDKSLPGSNNTPIEKWEWNYGDGQVETTIKGGDVNHRYANPGSFQASLTITDKEGCTATVLNGNYVVLKGPKAAFSVSENPALPRTNIQFANISNLANTNILDNQFTWSYGNGLSAVTDFYGQLSHIYHSTGVDTVRLIARNNAEKCADTAVQYVYIKNTNLNYSYSTTFLNPNSGCPPVLAIFNSSSVNVTGVSWNFGDGTGADNRKVVSHTYEKPGVYKVTLYGHFPDGSVDSTFEFITIQGPYATLRADKPFSCGAEAITLTAEAKNTTSYTWDFGDGTLVDAADSFAVHHYLTPGVYTPSLIVKDSNNCSFPFFLNEKIIIDTLLAAIEQQPAIACDSAVVQFTPRLVSIAKNELQQPMQYSWNFGTGAAADTSAAEKASFIYNKPGVYPVNLKVSSPYGCVHDTTVNITVNPVARGRITGPATICESTYATFKGSTDAAYSGLTWQWHFQGSDTSTLQNPPQMLFSQTGADSVTLIVNNKGCFDTTFYGIFVHAKPVIDLQPKQPHICVGSSVQLQAHDGVEYLWSPNTAIDHIQNQNPVVSPKTTAQYNVQVTNSHGCVNTDSVIVRVTEKFDTKADSPVYLCRGGSLRLNAYGAYRYHWIDGADLSDPNSANPETRTGTARTYTVVGYDSLGCFSDTAHAEVRIAELPTVNAGPDVTSFAGTEVQLTATGSSDVANWQWTPTDYLNCSNCATPISIPRSNITYTVQGTTVHGCVQKDSVNISIVCKASLVQIPTAFTPNGDLLNDNFMIKGRGIKLIKHFVVFGRWGDKIFEKSNVNANDRSAGWDGLYKGRPLQTGTYIYMAEIICDTGETYNYKGTVTLIR
ncbi:PKD domain-containing protein [Foetidibacter luteolus]|uniref:PKD domain-containing protein n=1 Tax=Foetidibacter luteolus TaxID=2608880 RepID=UPI00129B2154|nr:PKD domain-containing protein [Foetidibacter luteolus]